MTTEAKGHAHRITIRPEASHVKATYRGTVLAETVNALALREGRLPVRYYFRPTDVRMELLEPSTEHSTCPFKGDASYWTARIGEEVLVDVVWSYPDPIPDAKEIEGLLCFYSERVDVEVDGVRI